MIAVGTVLAGRYHVLSPLGAGGMGEVYRAKDQRLQREVAVKVLPERMTRDAGALSRFELEAQALAALSHPNILTIHDSGAEDRHRYAVMELLEGETLRERLARAPLAWSDAIEWGTQVARGLAAAHGKGIIHRDLKPENIFLTSDRGVKILDFGLAQLLESGAPTTGTPAEAEKTDPHVVMGTVNYMSPEQLNGRPLDARTDIFSLGCVLYEMVTRVRPFARPTPSGTIAAILAGEPPEVPESLQALPPGLQNAVLRCLRYKPEERFQTAVDLAFALEMISSGSLVASRGVSAAWGRPRHSRARVALGIVAGTAALLLASWLALQRQRPAVVSSLAVLPFGNAGSDPDVDYLSDGLTETVIHSLSQLPRLRVMARSTVFRYKGRNVEPQAVGRELKVDAVLVGRVVQRGDDVRIDTELVDTASGTQLWGRRYDGKFKDVLAVQERIAGEMSETLRMTLSGDDRKRLTRRHTEDSEAYRLYLKGRYHWNKRTDDGFRKGIEFFQRALERDPGYALAYAGLADSYVLLGAFGILPPREAMEKARAAATNALEMDETLAEAHASLGLTKLLYDWDWPGSEAQFRRAVQLAPAYATAHHWYGEYLMAMGRSREALGELTTAADLDPLSLIIATDMGRAHYFARSYDEAIAQYRKALEMDPRFAFAHICLGMAYEEKGMFDAALAEYAEVARLAGGRMAAVLLARAEARAGRTAEARKRLAGLLDAARTTYLSPHALAIVYEALGDRDETFRMLERSADERSQWLAYLKVDPRMDNLRADPRFIALLARVGLAGPGS